MENLVDYVMVVIGFLFYHTSKKMKNKKMKKQ
jgi:hypothetical protein